MWGALVIFTGGIDIRVLGVAVRSRDPFRAFAASVVLLIIQAIVFRQGLARDLERAAAMIRAWARPLAAAIALALAAHGLVFGTYSAGGSDAYGYVNQAYDWASGVLPQPISLSVTLPFPTSDPMQAPLGYRVGQQPHTIVPTYAPGLPLIMAAALVLGACGPFLVTPAFAALFVWFTFRLGERAGGPLTGLAAALLVAASPVVLYQTLWPMSDVPAGALWTAAVVYSLGTRRRDAVIAGLLVALGLLVRPNLLPVAAVPFVQIALTGERRERIVRVALYAAPSIVVACFVAYLNDLWYGSPLNSGYGAAGELYLRENVWPNLRRYGTWLWESQSPAILLALVPLLPVLRRRLNGRTIGLCALLCAVTFGCYVSYSQFEVWWYLRFLLPAFGAFAVLIAAGAAAIARTVPAPYGRVGAALAVWLIAATCLSFALGAGTFGRLQAGERRYAGIGEFVAQNLPGSAALLAVQHSGSLKFYGGRMTLRFDWIDKDWAAGVAPALERAGFHPYMVIDDAEVPSMRENFGLAADAPLPWPVVARMRELGGLTVYDMATLPSGSAPVALEPGSERWCGPRHRTTERR